MQEMHRCMLGIFFPTYFRMLQYKQMTTNVFNVFIRNNSLLHILHIVDIRIKHVRLVFSEQKTHNSSGVPKRQTRFQRSSQYFLLLLQTDLICIVYASITTRAKQLMIFSASLLFQVGSPWRSSHLNELVWQTFTSCHVCGGFLAVSLIVWNKPGVPCIYVETAVNGTWLCIYIVTPTMTWARLICWPFWVAVAVMHQIHARKCCFSVEHYNDRWCLLSVAFPWFVKVLWKVKSPHKTSAVRKQSITLAAVCPSPAWWITWCLSKSQVIAPQWTHLKYLNGVKHEWLGHRVSKATSVDGNTATVTLSPCWQSWFCLRDSGDVQKLVPAVEQMNFSVDANYQERVQ